jgi:hypothetical protein
MTLILAAKFLFAASIAMAGTALLAFVDELALLAALQDEGDQFADRETVIHNGGGTNAF